MVYIELYFFEGLGKAIYIIYIYIYIYQTTRDPLGQIKSKF